MSSLEAIAKSITILDKSSDAEKAAELMVNALAAVVKNQLASWGRGAGWGRGRMIMLSRQAEADA